MRSPEDLLGGTGKAVERIEYGLIDEQLAVSLPHGQSQAQHRAHSQLPPLPVIIFGRVGRQQRLRPGPAGQDAVADLAGTGHREHPAGLEQGQLPGRTRPRCRPASPAPRVADRGPGIARDDRAAWHAFIGKAWAASDVAPAVELASPSLAATVKEILSGSPAGQKKAVRAGMALARYMVRLRGRATPFGLFAGVAPARIGGPAAGTWGSEHQLAAHADGRWLSALATSLEARGPLRARLRVTASDLLTVRGDRIIVSWLPQASALARDTPAEISLRRTPAAKTALRLARTPVTVSELARKLAAKFGSADTAQAEGMIGELMACAALISDLRPPSTPPRCPRNRRNLSLPTETLTAER